MVWFRVQVLPVLAEWVQTGFEPVQTHVTSLGFPPHLDSHYAMTDASAFDTTRGVHGTLASQLIHTNTPLLAPTTTTCQRQHRRPQQHRHAIEGQGKGKGQGTLFSVLTISD